MVHLFLPESIKGPSVFLVFLGKCNSNIGQKWDNRIHF